MSLDLQLHFSEPLLQWFDIYGRKDLPWQSPRDAYRVWVSEIMLQQTQVQTVIDYFNRFINQLPTVEHLAQASDDQVLSLWSGLGYYSRARNLHQSAKILVHKHQAVFPQDLNALTELPGIGPSTAAAILSQAFNLPTAILDGNVKRVLTRFFAISGYPEQASVKKKLWELAQSCMSLERCADYTQAIMDLGATCCTSKKPDCLNCPLQPHCLAFKSKKQLHYPSKKIKKPVPTQHQQFLVLLNQEGQIYLEKRPPAGLWGGLWCLPSIDPHECALSYITDRYALTGNKPQALISFTHKFSHFHLNIDAVSIQVAQDCKQVMEMQGSWLDKSQLAGVGLAKPTSLILSSI